MKQFIKAFIISGFLMMVMAVPIDANEEQRQELDLNTDLLKYKKNDYSSVTDLNGVNLFTSDFREQVVQYESQMEAFYEQLDGTLFQEVTAQPTVEERLQNDIDKVGLFTKRQIQYKLAPKEEKTTIINWVWVIISVCLLGLTYCLTRMYYIRRYAKGKQNANNIIFYNENKTI